MLASTESISHLVVSIRSMSKREGVILQGLDPPPLPRAEFLLCMHESEGFVVIIEGEFSMKKTMPPKFKRLDDGV